jgi:hypothetical protein
MRLESSKLTMLSRQAVALFLISFIKSKYTQKHIPLESFPELSL